MAEGEFFEEGDDFAFGDTEWLSSHAKPFKELLASETWVLVLVAEQAEEDAGTKRSWEDEWPCDLPGVDPHDDGALRSTDNLKFFLELPAVSWHGLKEWSDFVGTLSCQPDCSKM